MLKALSAYARSVGRCIQEHFYTLARGIKGKNKKLVNQGLWSLGLMFIVRVVVLIALGLFVTWFGCDWDTYWGWVFWAYVGLVLIGFCVSDEVPVQEVPVPTNEVAVELARQRGVELQKSMLAFLFRIIVATQSMTNAIPPSDVNGVAVSSSDYQSFYMTGDVVVYQGEVQIDGDITSEVEDNIRNELQAAVPKYISDFPELIDPASRGRFPVEILTVRGVGRKVVVDAVITSEKTLSLIEARRQARIERKQAQKPAVSSNDPLFR